MTEQQIVFKAINDTTIAFRDVKVFIASEKTLVDISETGATAYQHNVTLPANDEKDYVIEQLSSIGITGYYNEEYDSVRFYINQGFDVLQSVEIDKTTQYVTRADILLKKSTFTRKIGTKEKTFEKWSISSINPTETKTRTQHDWENFEW